jgi:aspartyl-tRNA(Asn)/glutamyl-tRNA(Gln) amidotransferase subunit A
MHTKTLAQLSALLPASRSPRELAQHFLQRIAASDLNAFLHVDPALTLQQAAAADVRLANGDATALTGIPIAHKDIFVTKNLRSTTGSRMLENYVSPFDATVVTKLAEAGMVTLGKLNCDEFAMGSANENSYFGAVKNPWDKTAVLAARPAVLLPRSQRLTPAAGTDMLAARFASQPHFVASPVSSPLTAAFPVTA